VAGILVINPNSNIEVTRGIAAALGPLQSEGQRQVTVIGLEGTPRGIESQRDVDSVALPVAERIRDESGYNAYVIACFSDPGLYVAREATDRPVFGIAQAGLLTALTLGSRIGVISILSTSIPRHWRYYRALGVAASVAGDLALGVGGAELADEGRVGERMEATGRALVESHGADVLVLGCAGMARYRAPLERSLGAPVVDPTQAAVGLAQTAASLGLVTR
jgi:allantoin racemase